MNVPFLPFLFRFCKLIKHYCEIRGERWLRCSDSTWVNLTTHPCPCLTCVLFNGFLKINWSSNILSLFPISFTWFINFQTLQNSKMAGVLIKKRWILIIKQALRSSCELLRQKIRWKCKEVLQITTRYCKITCRLCLKAPRGLKN